MFQGIERAEMSDFLRKDILERRAYRCLCGAIASGKRSRENILNERLSPLLLFKANTAQAGYR